MLLPLYIMLATIISCVLPGPFSLVLNSDAELREAAALFWLVYGPLQEEKKHLHPGSGTWDPGHPGSALQR